MGRVKRTLKQALRSGQNLDTAMQEYRNMKMSGGAAPAELFYGRQLRGEMPGLRHSIDVEAAIKQRDTVRQEYLEKGNRKTSTMFNENYPVWIQNTANGLWDI